jgi:hypothetical protein
MSKPIDLYLDDEQLAALGAFTAHWTYLETEIDFTITAMAHTVTGSQKMPFPFNDRLEYWEKKILPRYPKLSRHGMKLYNGLHPVPRTPS